MEIERKWLIEDEDERGIKRMCNRAADIEQAYISYAPVIRLRKYETASGAVFELTIKGKGHISREEFNLSIDREEYDALMQKAESGRVRKTRYYIPLDAAEGSRAGLTAEVDFFRGSLAPLAVAEVEFETLEEAEGFYPPLWFGRDVRGEKGYSNADLARL